jgi:hypothetical protein
MMMANIKSIRFCYQLPSGKVAQSGGSRPFSGRRIGAPLAEEEPMTATFAPHHSFVRNAGVAAHAARDVWLAVRALAVAVVNRHLAARQLAGCDARMLRDLGVTPQDVAAAFGEPLWRDPTVRLSVLAVERRAAVRLSARENLTRREARTLESENLD